MLDWDLRDMTINCNLWTLCFFYLCNSIFYVVFLNWHLFKYVSVTHSYILFFILFITPENSWWPENRRLMLKAATPGCLIFAAAGLFLANENRSIVQVHPRSDLLFCALNSKVTVIRESCMYLAVFTFLKQRGEHKYYL